MKWQTVKAIINYYPDTFTIRRIQWMACAKRIDLNSADFADALKGYCDIFTQQNPDKTLYEAIEDVAKLTGWSVTYIKARYILNETGNEEYKELVRENKLKVSLGPEIKRLEPEQREIALQNEIDKAKQRRVGQRPDTSVINYRNVVFQHERIDRHVAEGKMTIEEGKAAKTDVTLSGGKAPSRSGKDKFGSHAKYLAEILALYDRIGCWNLDTLTMREDDNLVGRTMDCVDLLRNMQRQKYNTRNLKKTKFSSKRP